MQRQCTVCRSWAPLEHFIKKSGKCPACRRVQNQARRAQHREREIARSRAWRLANPERASAAIKAWEQAHPEKARERAQRWQNQNPERTRFLNAVYKTVKRALKKGLLVRPDTCEVCGGPGPIEAAHSDYSKPLEVRWLCLPCHRTWDRHEPKTLI